MLGFPFLENIGANSKWNFTKDIVLPYPIPLARLGPSSSPHPTVWHFEFTLQSNDPRCKSAMPLLFALCPSHSLGEGTTLGLAMTIPITPSSMPGMSVGTKEHGQK